MCPGSQMNDCNKEGLVSTNLLELAAADDLSGFKVAVEAENGIKIDQVGIWYGRKIGSRQMAFEERTPLMIASMFGSKHVVEYILQHDGIDVNRSCGSDGATALHCAVSGGSNASYEVVKLLLDACADFNSVDANGKRPADLLLSPVRCFPSEDHSEEQDTDQTAYVHIEKKEYPVDPTLPDIRNGVCGTDEFRMYSFKVKPCSRGYSHDWTECPFVHPGENARRRDPRKYHYSCVPCPEYRKGGLCNRGDICEYAHGVFESWLHPAQYRTRLCKDETNCFRRVCFFAHKPEELRLLYAASGSTPPLTPSSGSSSWGSQSQSQLVSKSRLKSSRIARDFYLDDELLELQLYSHNDQFLDYEEIYENNDSTTQLLSPKRVHLRRPDTSHSSSSSPVRPPLLISGKTKSASFANRSQSFIERGTSEDSPFYYGPSPLSDWSSPDGKLDWGMQKEDINKLRKSASFGFLWKNDDNNDHPDVSSKSSEVDFDQSKINGVQSRTQTPSWADLLFSDQKQIAA